MEARRLPSRSVVHFTTVRTLPSRRESLESLRQSKSSKALERDVRIEGAGFATSLVSRSHSFLLCFGIAVRQPVSILSAPLSDQTHRLGFARLGRFAALQKSSKY